VDIRPEDIVLEIGSGHCPYARADVLCDTCPFDSSQRASEKAVVDRRPFVVADGVALPFVDNAFGYVICRHVIEHSPDPAAFLEEICRVGRAGYIETPSDTAEDMFAWPVHHFKFRLQDGRLVVVKKQQEEPRFGDLFHKISEVDPWFGRWMQARRDLFYVQMEWKGRIDYEIVTAPTDPRAQRSPEYMEGIARATETAVRATDVSALMGRRYTLRRIMRAGLRRLKRLAWRGQAMAERFPPSRLIEILACPACRSKVRQTASGYACLGCGRDFPDVGGLPRSFWRVRKGCPSQSRCVPATYLGRLFARNTAGPSPVRSRDASLCGGGSVGAGHIWAVCGPYGTG
jgi:SAM-dependent methyltransferase